jgi:hypothetical protein
MSVRFHCANEQYPTCEARQLDFGKGPNFLDGRAHWYARCHNPACPSRILAGPDDWIDLGDGDKFRSRMRPDFAKILFHQEIGL